MKVTSPSTSPASLQSDLRRTPQDDALPNLTSFLDLMKATTPGEAEHIPGSERQAFEVETAPDQSTKANSPSPEHGKKSSHGHRKVIPEDARPVSWIRQEWAEVDPASAATATTGPAGDVRARRANPPHVSRAGIVEGAHHGKERLIRTNTAGGDSPAQEALPLREDGGAPSDPAPAQPQFSALVKAMQRALVIGASPVLVALQGIEAGLRVYARTGAMEPAERERLRGSIRSLIAQHGLSDPEIVFDGAAPAAVSRTRKG